MRKSNSCAQFILTVPSPKSITENLARAEKEFLKGCSTVGNGFTYISASGRRLGGDSYLGANGLGKAIEEYRKLPEEDRKPKVVRPEDVGSTASLPVPPPAGGLRANVYFAYLEPEIRPSSRTMSSSRCRVSPRT